LRLVSVYSYQGAFTILYDWLEDRSKDDDVNISHREMPSFQAHVSFVRSMPYPAWEFILLPGLALPIGYVSATNRNEISIILARLYRGKGYGPQAVELFMATHEPLPAVKSGRSGSWVANINPKNERSIAAFGKVGFRHIQNTYEFDPRGGTNGKDKGSQVSV
jgi:RimJ/RimL family protein N-acetyltransferase